MRITQNMMLRRYSRDLMNGLNQMDNIGLKVASGRKYQRASEDPMTSLKALQVRRNITDMEQYMKNIDYAESWLNQTETGLNSIKKCADDAILLINQGRNDILSGNTTVPLLDEDGNIVYNDSGEMQTMTMKGDRGIIATNIRSIQEQLLKNLNTQVAGKYIFGGANTKQAPFEAYLNPDDEDDPQNGHLIFNTQDLVEADHISDVEIDKIYYDLGMGFRLDENDDLVDPPSAFDMYKPGTDIILITDDDGNIIDNLYNLLGKIADAFDNDDMTLIDGLLNPDDADSESEGAGLWKKLEMAQSNALLELTNMGEKSKFVEYLRERTDANMYEANVLQNKLESIKYDEEIMNYQMQKMVYSACLQTGTYILQQSLMDYLRR